MDHPGVEHMKIAQILPEFHEGGVERHVLWLSNALADLGHQVTVISAGGKLEEKLDTRVTSWRLPVQLKNPISGLYSALQIASRAKREKWDIIHAHSRVPAWIAWWSSKLSSKPWMATAHAQYSLNMGISPLRKAYGVICVSKVVLEHLDGYLPENVAVVRNGIPITERKWESKGLPENPRFLFVGRLTKLKGLDVVLEALSGLGDLEWTLDVVGDGPQREELEALAVSLGIKARVRFHGFQDDPEVWMSESDLLVFPSLDEGMGLVLMQAIKIGLPALASDIDSVRELVGNTTSLVKPGDVGEWRRSIDEVIIGAKRLPRFDPAAVPSVQDMAVSVLNFYLGVINS